MGSAITFCKGIFIILIVYCILINKLEALKDPYQILGISQEATTQEIRKAYKKLVKEWHPDKNKQLDAEHKFVEIKQAYELLSDVERRRMYDQYGINSGDKHTSRHKNDFDVFDQYASNTFEEFFGKHFYFDQDISLYHKLSITTKYFEQTVVPKSSTNLYFLMFYNDWCFRCTRLAGAFKKLIETLEPLGVQFATVNSAHEQYLYRKIGVKDIPSFALIIDGYSYIYRQSTLTTSKIIEFIRKKLPKKIAQKVDDENIDMFLQGWTDNKARALIFEPRKQSRLRYLITAFAFHRHVAFGFVRLTDQNSQYIQERFKINPKLDTLLIFNEYFERAVASISMSEIPTSTLSNIIAANQYLTLPRLSSQDMLEGICPAEWNRPKKKLCVILVTENSASHNFARNALRDMAIQSGYNADRVRFAYIYKEKQSDFLNAMSKGSSDNSLLGIVIIWRRDISHLKYEWVHGTYFNNNNQAPMPKGNLLNLTKGTIDSTIQRLLKTSEALTYEAFVQTLLDEHAQGLITNFYFKISTLFEYFYDNLEKEHIFAILSLIGTIGLMFAVGYLMVYFVRVEEENLKTKGHLSNTSCIKQTKYVPELKIHELRAEKYNGMVRLLKPGCRTIVLITDLQTRTKLFPAFHKAVWPYRKSKTLIFGHMLIEKGLSWYSELLRLSLCESKNLHINPRNCVGTVIALNGHRKYFCMYHAKHPESTKGAKRMVKMAKQLSTRADDPEIGAFVESDNSENSESEPNILLEENLLNGLSNWLDRLFEGTTHRYYINYWPDFPTK